MRASATAPVVRRRGSTRTGAAHAVADCVELFGAVVLAGVPAGARERAVQHALDQLDRAHVAAGGSGSANYWTTIRVANNTIVGNSAGTGGGLWFYEWTYEVSGNIVAYNSGGGVLCGYNDTTDFDLPAFSYNDVYGNSGGDWVGEIADQLGRLYRFVLAQLIGINIRTVTVPSSELSLFTY